jgi:zinc/manganese transport system permease protein
MTRSPARAIAAAAAIGIAACWIGIVLSYDSYDWYHQSGKSWPVSFFVVTLIFLGYLLSGLPQRLRRRRASVASDPAPAARLS